MKHFNVKKLRKVKRQPKNSQLEYARRDKETGELVLVYSKKHFYEVRMEIKY